MRSVVSENVKVELNTDIYSILEPDKNVLLNDLSNSDKLYIIYLLKQYYLELRNRLHISKEITFGLELEFEEANRNVIEINIDKMFPDGEWTVVDDGSLVNGGEINSPILTDTESTWKNLETICNIIEHDAFVLENTGSHIHIGMHILGNNPKYWANFVKLWMAYENVIFRFLYGEYVSPRSEILEQARPLSMDLIKNIDRINDRAKMKTASYLLKVLDAGKDYRERRKRAVNFTNVSDIAPYKYNSVGDKNTIEFRSPNGTLNPVIWQNNVNFLVHLMMYAKSDNFDEDIIDRRILYMKENNIPSNLYKYSFVYREQAIELADLIFNNNLDKIYFLRQYIKDERVGRESLDKSKNFTRRRVI